MLKTFNFVLITLGGTIQCIIILSLEHSLECTYCSFYKENLICVQIIECIIFKKASCKQVDMSLVTTLYGPKKVTLCGHNYQSVGKFKCGQINNCTILKAHLHEQLCKNFVFASCM